MAGSHNGNMANSIHIKSDPPAPVLVVALGPLQASVTLFFDLLPLAVRRMVRVMFCGDPSVKFEIRQASAVIFVRSLLEYEELIAYAKAVDVPMYHYCDDNFVILGEELDRYGGAYAFYTRENMRRVLSDFAGCLLSVPNLVDFYRRNCIHPRLALFPPVAAFEEYGDIPNDRAKHRAFTVSFFGGGDRRRAFAEFIVPAAKLLSKQRPVVLVAFGVDIGAVDCAEYKQLTVFYPPYEPDYALAIRQFRHYAPDVMLHSSSPTKNNAYKNCNNIINGALVGAAMVCSRTEPYFGLEQVDATLLADDNAHSWYLALWQLANSNVRLAQLRAGGKTYCESLYNGLENTAVLNGLLNDCPKMTSSLLAERNICAFSQDVVEVTKLEDTCGELADAVSIRDDALRVGREYRVMIAAELKANREKIKTLFAGAH